jgi:hypothetical protein
MAKAKTTPAAPKAGTLDDFSDYPNVAVLERRMENPEDPGSMPIFLKDEPRPSCGELQHFARSNGAALCVRCKTPFRRWYVRWINSSVPNRLHAIVHNKAYVKVMKSELVDVDQISDLAPSVDDTVRKGEKGQIVLVKIPFRAYAAIKAKERERRGSRERSAKHVRDDLAESIGAQMGDEAGDAVSKFTTEFSRPASTVASEMAEDE